MPVEMADRDTLVPIPTIADDEAQIAAFTEALIATDRAAPRHAAPAGGRRRPGRCMPQTVLAPREAFFAANETVSADAGRRPGQRGADRAVPARRAGARARRADHCRGADALREVKADGGRIAYAADPSLATFQVVC